jgi:hypothetical protein
VSENFDRSSIDGLRGLLTDGKVIVLSGAGCPQSPGSRTIGVPPVPSAGTRQ